MEEKNADHTMQEILEEDSAVVRKKGRRKGCLARFLLILTLLAVFFYGMLVVIQYLTDLEAEARVRAIQTAGPDWSVPLSETDVVSTDEPTEIPPSATPLPPTETPDAQLARTATVAAELTAVADFQWTAEPTR